MWKIFQKEALGILRYPSRIDFFKIPDHVVLSEFTEMKVTLKTNSALQVVCGVSVSTQTEIWSELLHNLKGTKHNEGVLLLLWV